MRKSSERSLDSAYYNRAFGIEPFQVVAIHVHASVGAHTRLSALTVYVAGTLDFGYGIVVDHTVHNSAGYHKSVLRHAETHIIAIVLRLSDYGYVHAERLQKAGHDCVSERGMVNVCLTYDVDNVHLSSLYFLF